MLGKTRIVSAAMLVVVLCVSATVLQAKDLEKLNFRFSWSPYGSIAPYFLALEKGYFSEEGLDVKFDLVMGTGTLLKLMAQGSDPIGDPDFGALMKGVSKGMEITAVYGLYQKSTFAIASHIDKPIRTPEDLIGKTIAMGREESSAQIFPALLAANKIDINKITVVHPAEGAKLGIFLNKTVDAITVSANIQKAVIEGKGEKLALFGYGDYGVNTLNNGIAVNTKWLAANGDKMKGFLRGISKGYKAAMANPEAAVDAMIKHHPDQADQRDVFLSQLKDTFPLLHTAHSKDKPLGWMAKEDWEETQKLLAQYGGLEKTTSVEKYYTNEFVPQ